MTAAEQDATAADAAWAGWMRENLDRAAEQFGLTVVGEPILGWRMLTVSASVDGPEGLRWLRVRSEDRRLVGGAFWTGNVEANAIAGIPKPLCWMSSPGMKGRGCSAPR